MIKCPLWCHLVLWHVTSWGMISEKGSTAMVGFHIMQGATGERGIYVPTKRIFFGARSSYNVLVKIRMYILCNTANITQRHYFTEQDICIWYFYLVIRWMIPKIRGIPVCKFAESALCAPCTWNPRSGGYEGIMRLLKVSSSSQYCTAQQNNIVLF